MRRALVLIGFVGSAVSLTSVTLADLAAASHVCDPYPIGYCGTSAVGEIRDSVIFCYVKVNGLMVSATDPHVVTVGGPSGVAVDTVERGVAYVSLKPAETLIADPNNAPLPTGTLWKEKNLVAGLQRTSFMCGTFLWFPECEPAQWMGPFAVSNKAPDERVF